MKIGIASNDQRTIAQHFGRTAGFVLAEIQDGKEITREYRANTFSHHKQQATPHQGDHSHAEHGHSHASIIEALSDCSVVLSRGMGQRIYNDLRTANIEAFITDQENVDLAISAYLDGTLENHPEKGCVH